MHVSQKPFTSSEDNARKPISDNLKCRFDLEIRQRSLKSNQLVFPSQQCIYASLVRIHHLVQKKTHRKEATRTLTGSAPKQYAPTLWIGGGGGAQFGTSLENRSSLFFALIQIRKKHFAVLIETYKGIPKNRGWCIQDTVEL